jgi:uncharacterized SAM-binding protein YcdF (DUF218 family)
MSLSALPTALLLPPVNLLVPCAAGLLLWRRRPRTARLLLTAGMAGLLVLSLPVVSRALIASLETNLPLALPAADPPGAIVILSAEALRNNGVLEPGPLTLERLRTGAALHRSTGLPVLVTGGIADYDDDGTLAATMARSLRDDFNVPVRWMEEVSQDTRENAVLSAPLLLRDGVRSAYVVTHAWHIKRAVLAFAGTGVAVTAAPVRMDEGSYGRLSDFVPRARSWQDSYWALHEWAGIAAASVPGLRRREPGGGPAALSRN